MKKNSEKYFISDKVKEGFNTCSMQEVYDYCKTKSILSLDTETTGLDPFLDKVIMLQIGDLDKGFAIDTRKVDISILKDIIEDDKILKIGVNVKFDAKMLFTNFGFRMSGLRDNALIERILNTVSRKVYHSMAQLSLKYLDIDLASPNYSLFPELVPDKSTAKEFLRVKDKEFTTRQINYGLLDVEVPMRIYLQQINLVEKFKLQGTVMLEHNYLEASYTMELSGMFVDSSKWMELYELNRRKYNWYLFICNTWLVENNMDHYLGINWNSSKQVIKLFKELNIPTQIIDRAKSKGDDIIYKDTVQETHITQYREIYPLVPIYLKLRKFYSNITKFGEKFLKNIHPKTGRIHTSYYPILVTGRVSSQGPNLQQIPGPDKTKKAPFRACFTAQSEDFILVTADFSSQEVRTVADKSNEKSLIDFYNKGDDDDVHSLTARKMFKVNVTKRINPHLRQRAKTLLFGILYGISPYKVAKDFGVTVKEAEKFIELFYKSYPGLKPYFIKQQRQFLNNGWIRIDEVTGRIVRFQQYHTYKYCYDFIERFKNFGWKDGIPSEIWKKYNVYRGMMSRSAQNYPIQGQAANITKLSTVLMHKYIKNNNLWDKIKIIVNVHDEIVLEAHKDYAAEAQHALNNSMMTAGAIFCTKIKMKVDSKISEQWEH
jgi:DNA polymerase-1